MGEGGGRRSCEEEVEEFGGGKYEEWRGGDG